MMSYLFPVSPGTSLVGPSATAINKAKEGKSRHKLVMYYCGPRQRKEHCMLAGSYMYFLGPRPKKEHMSYVLFWSSAKKGNHCILSYHDHLMRCTF